MSLYNDFERALKEMRDNFPGHPGEYLIRISHMPDIRKCVDAEEQFREHVVCGSPFVVAEPSKQELLKTHIEKAHRFIKDSHSIIGGMELSSYRGAIFAKVEDIAFELKKIEKLLNELEITE